MNERPTKRSRTIASQACDSCRTRKIRCDFSNAQSSSPASSSAGANSRVCRGCEDVGIPCTFDMPVKRRGPPSKLAKANGHGQLRNPVDRTGRHGSPKSQRDHESSTGSLVSPHAPVSGSPLDLTGRMQLPSALGHSPTLFHLRYNGPKSPSQDAAQHVSPTDRLCSRPLFDEMMQDYLNILYPLVPVIHKPTFLEDLQNRRELYDTSFLSLLIAMCASLVATIPSRFYYYCSKESLPFQSRTAMVEFCHEYILSLRRANTFDHPTFTTWSAGYVLALAYVHLGTRKGRSHMLTAEVMQQACMLSFHELSTYDDLNNIEKQLYMKAHWLTFFGFVHQKIDLHLDGLVSLYTRTMLENLTFDELLPAEVDDEYIFADQMLSQPPDQPSITIGFNANCRIFWASVTNDADRVSPSLLRTCAITDQLSALQTRLQRVKDALNDIHPQLSHWNISTPVSPASGGALSIRDSQFESMRANVHVGHLWLQSMLFDQTVSVIEQLPPASRESNMNNKALWNEREDICRRLLTVLYNISQDNLEPNGNVLVNKIRAVATTLLDCPFAQQGNIARRANNYIENFASLLANIDVVTADNAASSVLGHSAVPSTKGISTSAVGDNNNNNNNNNNGTLENDGLNGDLDPDASGDSAGQDEVDGTAGLALGRGSGLVDGARLVGRDPWEGWDVQDFGDMGERFWRELDEEARRGVKDFAGSVSSGSGVP